MNETVPTFAQVFTDPDPDSKDSVAPDRDKMRAALRSKLPGFEWVASKYDFVEKINEVLGLGVPDFLFGFWRKTGEIEAALKDSMVTPDEPVDIGLVDHEIEGKWEPQLEVRIGREPAEVSFDIPLALSCECALEGIVLKIKNGSIVGIIGGKCSLTGNLMMGDLVVATAPRKGQKPIEFEAS